MARTTKTPTMAKRVLIVSVIAVTTTMVIASILMNTPLGPKVVIAGPLSSQHAMLADDCTHCHSAEMNSAKGVLHGIVNSELSIRDSALCLECHDIGADAMRAHAMSASRIEAHTELIATRPLESWQTVNTDSSSPPHSAEGEYACAVCHVEHEGRMNSLTSIGDSQCQSCHSVQFESFEHGHPEFTGYPYREQLSIAFDHSAHIYDNFIKKNPDQAPTACTDCHSVDPAGHTMTTAPFEDSCITCHEADVRGSFRSAGAGIEFFTLPAIDTMTLQDAGVGIGAWPADSGIADGTLSPFTQLMLSSDERARDDLALIRELDLMDLMDATEAQLASVSRVAWALKALAMDISEGGHGAILSRVGDSTGTDENTDLENHLTGGLSRAMWHGAIDAWFPGLRDELSQHNSERDPPTEALESAEFTEADSPGAEWSAYGGWYRDDMSFSIRYRPTGHADSFLRAWADLAANSRGAGQPLLDAFTRGDAVGKCLTCHTLDSSNGGLARINWKARQPEELQNSLTKFRHSPHLPLFEDEGCLHCHTVNQPSQDFSSPEIFDSGIFANALAPMSQATCAECHTPDNVQTSCLGCHNYHEHRPAMRLTTGALRPDGS